MIGSVVAAAELPAVDRDQAAAIGHAEGRAALTLLLQLGDGHWQRCSDCAEWSVRTIVSHLVAQCEDSIRMTTMLSREIAGRRRFRDMTGVDAHTAAQVDDHRADTGPELVERFALLWPRAVQARLRRPRALRRLKIDLGIPGLARVPFSYLLDVIYNRDLWMHRMDLARATDQPFVVGDHDQHIIAQAVRDLARQWTSTPALLELTGPAGGAWIIGSGEPTATIRANTLDYMRALAGRDTNVTLTLVSGASAALAPTRQATIAF